MSAWIVEKALIDCLVQSAVVEGLVPMADADPAGQMLWHENYLSIEARYGDPPLTPTYQYEGIEAPLNDAIVMRQIGCYSYQTCEHDGWGTSEAKALCGRLEAVLVARHDGDMDFDRNWEAATGQRAPWGISNLAEAVAQ